MEKMKQLLISLVIPAYNIEDYIERTLDSVFAQTYRNLEVIAVDDGSSDATGALLDRYAGNETRLHVLHQENAGASRARLAGIRTAKGDYIGFVDGDDLIDPGMYERLLDNAIKYAADISHCGYRMVFPDGTIQYYYNSGKIISQDHHEGIADLLEGTMIESALCSKLFRRDLFQALSDGKTIMDLSLKENEDLLMNYCLFRAAHRSVFEDVCPYQYQVRMTSVSHGGLKPHILSDPIRIGQLLIEDTKDDPQLQLLAARYYVTKLIKAATLPQRQTSAALLDIRKKSRLLLKDYIKEYLHFSESGKRKALALWAACSPATYGLAHRFYLRSSK